MMKLSELLDAFEAEDAVVSEVRKLEMAQSKQHQFLDAIRNIEKFWEPDDVVSARIDDLIELGWYIGKVSRHPDGFSIWVRDHTADYPGMKERQFSGKTISDALQQAISQLQAEDWDDRPED